MIDRDKAIMHLTVRLDDVKQQIEALDQQRVAYEESIRIIQYVVMEEPE